MPSNAPAQDGDREICLQNIPRAMDKVIEARPIAFTAQGWKEFALEVLCHYQAEPGETRI